MDAQTAVALGLAAASTTLTSLAYLREHDAAARMPELSMRRPLQSVRTLLADRSWLRGFAMESTGFLLYAAALGLASLTLVQSVNAGGIGVLAFVSSRLAHRRLPRRDLVGVGLSVLGLLALAVSLEHGSGGGGRGSTVAILLWLGATAAAGAVLLLGRRFSSAAAAGAAGGLFFSIGDISTKVATEGGVRALFVITLVAGYSLGSIVLQLGYQRGTALTVSGIATLLTNALPILAGTLILHEPVPTGVWGVLRVFAFAAVTVAAVLLAEHRR